MCILYRKVVPKPSRAYSVKATFVRICLTSIVFTKMNSYQYKNE